MESSFASHERRLVLLNSQLDTKYREVISAASAAAQKYPTKKSPRMRNKPEQLTIVSPNTQPKDSTGTPNSRPTSSRSRGVMTLESKQKRVADNKQIPLPEKDLISSDDDDDLGAPSQEAPMQEQFRNNHFKNSTGDLEHRINNWNVNNVDTPESSVVKPPLIDTNTPTKEDVIKTPASIKTNSLAKHVTDDGAPRKNLSSDALIKFLKAKVSILQHELDTSQKEVVRLTEKNSFQAEEYKRLCVTQERAHAKNKNLGDELRKKSEVIATSTSELKHHSELLDESQRRLDECQKETSQLTRANAILERRVTKATEDLDATRGALEVARSDYATLEAHRKQELRAAEEQLRIFEQQRDGLIAAYKRQMMLLDNLKRQNVCLQKAKLLDFTERDFIKLLDWNKD